MGILKSELLTLYRGATADNECPMMVEKIYLVVVKADLAVGYVQWLKKINLWKL